MYRSHAGLRVHLPLPRRVSRHCSPAPPLPTVPSPPQGKPENVAAAQTALLKRAKANSDAQQGKYDPATDGKEAAQGMYEKGYVY
jgi:hypothetical protein